MATTKTFQLETVSCPSCIAKIEGALSRTSGVELAEVLFNSSRVRVKFDEEVVKGDDLKAKIDGLGYRVLGER